VVSGPVDAVISPAGPDAVAFLGRLLRMEPVALVRLRPAGTGSGSGGLIDIWARLPFGALVTRRMPGQVPDVTVRAVELFERVRAAGDRPVDGLPTARDAEWRWPLPGGATREVEQLPAAVVREVASSAAKVVRQVVTGGVGGRPVGERVLRDALLDHVPFTVTTDAGERFEVSQRLVQAVARMGFLGVDSTVRVLVVGPWVGLAAEYGTAWHRHSALLTSSI